MLSSHPPPGFFGSCLYDLRLKSISHCLSPTCVLQVHDCHMTGEKYVLLTEVYIYIYLRLDTNSTIISNYKLISVWWHVSAAHAAIFRPA
jgi:hypothetical protein